MKPSAGASWSDDDLLKALLSGGPRMASAQSELLRLLTTGLRRAFQARPDALEWVEDFAQEGTMRVLQQLPTFRGESRFTTWALAIAVRVAFDELRRRRWRDLSLDALVDSGHLVPLMRSEDPARDMARQRTLDVLQLAMKQHLTEKQMLALTGELKGVPQSELGRQLGSNRIAIYKLTHDARKRLKQVLSDQGITADSVRWAFDSSTGE